MGYTNPNYPIFEIALSLEDCAPHTNGTKERKLSGDIVAIRKPAKAIGRMEAKNYLWLRVEGLEENEMARLADILQEGVQMKDKRRYCIPLDRLKEVVPSFDITKAKDTNLIYQPFLAVDEENYFYLDNEPTLSVHGLVFDKLTRNYI